MEISFDPAKRAKTLAERGLDFADATRVFASQIYTGEDDRTDYGERRMITYGYLDDRASWWCGPSATARRASFRCDTPMKRKCKMPDWVDPDDAPLLTKDFFERAEIRIGGKVVREASGSLTRDWSKSGRPPVGDAPKEAVSLRLDRDVLAHFRESGPGWQTRMNAALRKSAGLG